MPSLGDRRIQGGVPQVYIPGAGWVTDTSTGQPAPPAPTQPPPGTSPSPLAPQIPPLVPQIPAVQEPQGRFARREAILSRNAAAPPAAPLPFLGPGAAQAARFQNIAPSAIIPQVGIQSPTQAPRSIGEALDIRSPGALRFLAGGSLAAEQRAPAPVLPVQAPPQPAAPAARGTVDAGGFNLEQNLLSLAATDPERLRERARFINMSRDRGAQIDVGVALTAESMARGHFPDVMTDAVASRLADLYGYGSLEEMMSDLGYLPNPDAPGTWLRREAAPQGAFGAGGFGGFGGQPIFVQGAVPRATRGGGYGLGLVNWRI